MKKVEYDIGTSFNYKTMLTLTQTRSMVFCKIYIKTYNRYYERYN